MAQNDGWDIDDKIDPDTLPAPELKVPVAQWLIGNKGAGKAAGFAYTGGWWLPAKYDFAPEGWEWMAEREFVGSGKGEAGYQTPTITVAILRQRFRAYTTVALNGKAQRVYAPYRDFVKGVHKSQRHVLAMLRAGEHPPQMIVLTLDATLSQQFGWAFSDFRKRVIEAAGQLRQKQYPYHAFWMPLRPSGHVKVGDGQQSSWITAPELDLPEELTEADLKGLSVGAANLALFNEAYKSLEVSAWMKTWDTAPAQNGHTSAQPEETTQEAPDDFDQSGD